MQSTEKVSTFMEYYQSTAHGLGGGRARHYGSHSESSLQEATEKPARFARRRLPRRGSSPSKTGRDKYTWPPRVPAVIAGNARAHGTARSRGAPLAPVGAPSRPAAPCAVRPPQATSGAPGAAGPVTPCRRPSAPRGSEQPSQGVVWSATPSRGNAARVGHCTNENEVTRPREEWRGAPSQPVSSDRHAYQD